VTKRAFDYTDALGDPLLRLPRRLALQVVVAAREMADASDLAKPRDIEDPADDLCRSFACVNCDREITERAAVFCDKYCTAFADTVRYARATIADGRIEDGDVQEVLGTKILMLAGGGYPKEERRLSRAKRHAIFERDGYKCQVCGVTATEIDHIRGNSDDPSNLRAICGPCNRDMAFGNARVITRKENPKEWNRLQKLHAEIALRIGATLPLRLCDDAVWKEYWNGIFVERKRRLREIEDEDENGFEDTDDYLYDAIQKDD
jgi:hypothetical protein